MKVGSISCSEAGFMMSKARGENQRLQCSAAVQYKKGVTDPTPRRWTCQNM